VRAAALLFASVASLACAACAGARTEVVAPRAEVPVSLSHAVRTADGALLPADRREVVGKFHDERTAWGLFYSAVKLTPEKDISDELNAQVARSGGDAVVTLRVQTSGCAANYFAILNALPMWPGCTKVTIDGDIIRVRPASAPPVVASAGEP
jgi:hypothetical protein